jgi:colanic acid biosynthesis glycosyl transferase WcaI
VKILIVGINFTPELTGIGKYSGEMAEWLAARGHEVRVVTAPPYYPQWRIAEGYSNGWRIERAQAARDGDGKGGLTVYRCPIWVPKKLSGKTRLLHLVSFALSSLPFMLRQIFWRPDAVIAIEPPLMCAPSAWISARVCGARAWLHIQDFEVDAAFDMGILRSGRMRRFARLAEQWLLRRFDRVSTISPRMLDKLRDKSVPSTKAVLFPNWVNTAELKVENPGSGHYRAALGIPPDAVVALYSGNMGAKQGLELLAQAAGVLRNATKVVFVFCGEGAGRAELVASCDGLPNVRFMDLQPSGRLGELLGMADIHLLPQRADVADLVMPSKLTGMLASGRPVVATAAPGTQVAEVVRHCGIAVMPGDAASLAQAVMRLAEDGEGRAMLGKKARVYAETHLDQNAVLTRFEQDLIECVTEN